MTKLAGNLLKILSLILFLSIHTDVMAEEEVEEDAETEELEALMYYAIEPNTLTFYQGTGKKIGYIVVQVNIAVRGQDNYDLVELHLPLIQDNLTDFFNRQDKSVIQDIKKRENLRQQAQASVTSILKEETGKDVVENLLFTDYVYQ